MKLNSLTNRKRLHNAPKRQRHCGPAAGKGGAPVNEDRLWQAHLRKDDSGARDQLLQIHLGLVHHVARKLSKRLPAGIDLGDLIGSGMVGLMNAIDSFEPERRLAFSTYAALRIQGAILDELRRQDSLSRSVRKKARSIAEARHELEHELRRTPAMSEIAKRLDIDVDTYASWQDSIRRGDTVSLDRTRKTDHGSDQSLRDVLPGDGEEVVEDPLNHAQEMKLLREAMEDLNEQEQTVLGLYYFEELKLREIAELLALTESRISQVRSKALAKLRDVMIPLRQVPA